MLDWINQNKEVVFSGLGTVIFSFIIGKIWVDKNKVAKIQKQSVGKNSTNVQVGRDLVSYGITYSDARQIAVDLIKLEVAQFRDVAADVFRERIEHIAQQVVEEVSKRTLGNFSVFKDPDFQFILHKAQVDYGRRGEKPIEELLVNLIGERSLEKSGSTKQSVLNEAIEVGGRLNGSHLKILASIFIPTCAVAEVNTLKELGEYFDETIAGPLSDFAEQDIEFAHLDFLRCLSHREVIGTDILSRIRDDYAKFFAHGVEPDRFPKNLPTYKDDNLLFELKKTDIGFLKSLNYPENIEYRLAPVPLNKMAFNSLLVAKDIPEDDRKLLDDLYGAVIFNKDITKAMILKECPRMDDVFKKWERSSIKKCQLTSVGKVLAISYLKNIGVKIDFDKWLT